MNKITPEGIGTRYIPITRWPEYHPYPTVSGMRYLRFHQKELGYTSAFVRLNKRILVDEQEFFRILRSQQGEPNKKPS
jgi:hypothetical protein